VKIFGPVVLLTGEVHGCTTWWKILATSGQQVWVMEQCLRHLPPHASPNDEVLVQVGLSEYIETRWDLF